MILGIGSDLVDMRRIEKTIVRFGDRFLDRVFTTTERAKAERRAGARTSLVATYARRFAAKEACAKALGTGLRRGVFWRDMGVENLPSGQPTLRLTGGAAARLQALTPDGMTATILLTMTDEPPIAEAMVVIEARPAANV
jgi:holo-[acyl-carrier protein] synthase